MYSEYRLVVIATGYWAIGSACHGKNIVKLCEKKSERNGKLGGL